MSNLFFSSHSRDQLPTLVYLYPNQQTTEARSYHYPPEILLTDINRLNLLYDIPSCSTVQNCLPMII